MQNVSSLYSGSGLSKVTVKSPFSRSGTRTVLDVAEGLPARYAMPVTSGGTLITSSVANWIGWICSLDEFMSACGATKTYVSGITYLQTALLEYVDMYNVTHPVMAAKNNPGDFRGHSNISSTKWKVEDMNTVTTNLYFN